MAQCNYYRASVNPFFLKWVADQQKSENFEANFSEFPGIENGNSEINLDSLASSLENNNFFDSLVFYNIPRKDMFSSLSIIFRSNKKILKFVASKLGNSSKIGELGKALASNINHQLVILDLSYNSISYNDFFFFIDMLDKYNHNLPILNLANCDLNNKSIAELFTSFQRNYGMSMTIEHLLLDGSNFGVPG